MAPIYGQRLLIERGGQAIECTDSPLIALLCCGGAATRGTAGQYRSPVVDDDDLTIKLNRDQAIVLSDWLYRMMGTPTFDSLVNEERAVWSPLYTIAGTLDTSLVKVFMPDYTDRIQSARQRLLDSLGDIGRPPSER